ncbi:M50 family metallopeptidase [Verrucosispora sp. WMMA2044]|uniref:Zinc metalloprotease n=1 Tax=Verrucosispora sioxanthis TaxID=2499994 RepID=A0A6M1L5S5_9ACTN|nr:MULTISPECIES: M50 family metallopeptidase [Micromonospora]NEE63924.1 peptidase M50 [Verrucosispora sioxanthis]NGM13034.1 peptidase M50 [Verrucosispora sioxanthis]WBB50996.1 M50 family metallopeptidase [Verrucosispora sp. WMMA2044]
MEQRRRPRAGQRPGIRVGRILGVPLYLNASILLLALLITVLYGELAGQRLQLSPLGGYLVGAGFVLALLGSVLAHELGHALTARRFGIGVRGITLELLGGYTEMDRDAPSPRVDLLVSLAGPAVSAVLGAAAVAATLALPDRTVADQLAFQLAASNVIVALFNILPGLPLDGGRALRAVVWALTRDRHRATEVAGWAGRILAVGTALLVAALYAADVLSLLALPLTALVALTLWHGAGQSIRMSRIGRRLPLVDLATLARPVHTVPTGTPLAEAQRRAAPTHPLTGPPHPAALLVTDSAGRPVALVDPVAAAAVPEARRPWLAVDAVARTLADLPAIPVHTDGERVLETVQAHPGAQYVVTAGEDVVGVLHIADLAQLLEPHRKMNT